VTAHGAGRAPAIAFVSPYSQLAGSERHLELVLDGLPPEQIAALVYLQEGPAVEEQARHGRMVTVIPTGAGPIEILRTALTLRRLLAASGAELVHANGLKAALVAVLATRGRRLPVVWVKHDLTMDRSLARPVARGCRLVVGVSQAAVRVFRGRSRRRVRVVLNALPPVAADREQSRRLVRERLGAPQDAPVLGLIGRLYAMKGQHELLELLPDLVRELPQLRVAFAGPDDPAEPDYAILLRERAAELGLDGSVTFTGRVDDAAGFAAGCDVVVAPSVPAERGNTESFSLVALEAMWVGTPVVAYAEGGLPEVLGDCGLLVPPGDRDALMGALLRCLTDPALRERLADCGRERAATGFDLERMRQGFEACWLEALER
jgi:glycosyltransferase involved in cell wall biosynthesis